MKKASIISIGSEIMRGKIDDTNSTYISKWLTGLGVIVDQRISVEDDVKKINDALTYAKESDLVILTGGLGPTDDDLTREAVAEYLNTKLEYSEKTWSRIEIIFKKRYKNIPESNKKQAMIIPGCKVINNKVGTAPGLFYKNNKNIIVLLPGPPKENKLMIKVFLEKKLRKLGYGKEKIYTKVIRIYNAGESIVADIVNNMGLDCELGYYFNQNGWIELHFTGSGKDAEKINKILSHVEKKLKGENLFITENEDIGYIVYKKLKENKLKIAFAESITGGGVSAALIKYPGASNIFIGSTVVYSNEAKMNILKVSEATLKKYGAVSNETVIEMVKGLKNIFDADIYVSISGIAGPTGGSDNKPVGLVHFGFSVNNNDFSKKEIFIGDRGRIISKSINFVFMEILEMIGE